MTHRTSIILEVEVAFGGAMHAARYFVEHGVVHACIGGRIVPAPLGDGDAQGLVRSLLLGHLQQRARKAQHVRRWRIPDADGPGSAA